MNIASNTTMIMSGIKIQTFSQPDPVLTYRRTVRDIQLANLYQAITGPADRAYEKDIHSDKYMVARLCTYILDKRFEVT